MNGLIIYILITQLFFFVNFTLHFKYNKKFNKGQRDFCKTNPFHRILLVYVTALAVTPIVWPYMFYVGYKKYSEYKYRKANQTF